jgi:hypothetical protein
VTETYWQKFDPIEDLMPPMSRPMAPAPPVKMGGGPPKGFSLNLGAVKQQQKQEEKVPRLGGFLQ